MGVYSNTEIEQAIRDGIIVCTPLNQDHIAEASLDVTLGYYYYQQEFRDDDRIYNPFDSSEVERYFKGPLVARPHGEWASEKGINLFANIPEDQFDPLLGIVCPSMLFPYLRANVADAINRTSLPPLHLADVNFQSLFEQNAMAQAEAARAEAGTEEEK